MLGEEEVEEGVGAERRVFTLNTLPIRVFRKRVKSKDINGHPPIPSEQSYY